MEESAKQSGRSMNAEVVARIEASYKLEDAMDLVLDQAKQIKELRAKVMESNFTMAQALQVLLGKDRDQSGAIAALQETCAKTDLDARVLFQELVTEHVAKTGDTDLSQLRKLVEAARKQKS